MARDTVTPLVDAARDLADAIERAGIGVTFTEDGGGPFFGLIDGWLDPDRGPIRDRAARLREALLDHERAALVAELVARP